MDTNIKNAQLVLQNGGVVIKTHDDHELILVNKNGIIQNINDCNWRLNEEGGGIFLHLLHFKNERNNQQNIV